MQIIEKLFLRYFYADEKTKQKKRQPVWEKWTINLPQIKGLALNKAGIAIIIIRSWLMDCKAWADHNMSLPLTLMKECRVFPYIFWNWLLMSNMSISALETIILMRMLSVVPRPLMRKTETTCRLCSQKKKDLQEEFMSYKNSKSLILFVTCIFILMNSFLFKFGMQPLWAIISCQIRWRATGGNFQKLLQIINWM